MVQNFSLNPRRLFSIKIILIVKISKAYHQMLILNTDGVYIQEILFSDPSYTLLMDRITELSEH